MKTSAHTNHNLHDVISQISMTIAFLRSSSKFIAEDTVSTLSFMLQHCSSSIVNHESTNAAPPSLAPFTMAMKYIDGLGSQKISESIQNDLRFMLSECQSTLLRLHTQSLTDPESFFDVPAFGDDPMTPRAADEGGRAGSICRSLPRSRHWGNVRFNHFSSQRAADEGGCAGLSCRSLPRLHHQGGDDSTCTTTGETFSVAGKKVLPTMEAQEHPHRSLPLDSISIRVPCSGQARKRDSNIRPKHRLPPNKKTKNKKLAPSSQQGGDDSTCTTTGETLSVAGKKVLPTMEAQEHPHRSLPLDSISIRVPCSGQARKRDSNIRPKHRLPPNKKTKNKKLAPSSLLTLQEFYNYLSSKNNATKDFSSFDHNYLVFISPWKCPKFPYVQSTLCTSHDSGSFSVLSTSSAVSLSSPLQSSTMHSNTHLESSLFSIGAIERNPRVQMYRVSGLGKNDHFTCNHETFHELKSIPPVDLASRNLTIVPCTQELYNSAAITVVNSVSSPNPNLDCDKSLNQAKSFLSKIFNAAYPHFSVSASKSRNLPSISFGWTTTDCNSYKYHRTNIVGQIKPFLIKTACDDLSIKLKRKVAKLSCLVINHISIHSGLDIFTYDEAKKSVKDLRKLREYFWHEYAKTMGLDIDKDSKLLEHFRCDGNSLIINPYVEKHKDTHNDQSEQWDNTLSINAQLPITPEMWSCSSFSAILNKLGYSKSNPKLVSVSLMIYSRKCIGDYCQSVVKTKDVCRLLRERGNPIVDVVMEGLSNVSSPTNYRSQFDNVDCFKMLSDTQFELEDKVRFLGNKKKKRTVYSPQYRGLLSERVAAYDKLVSPQLQTFS